MLIPSRVALVEVALRNYGIGALRTSKERAMASSAAAIRASTLALNPSGI